MFSRLSSLNPAIEVLEVVVLDDLTNKRRHASVVLTLILNAIN